MNDTTISVIVAAYNVSEWIEECLDSIINQTYKDLEIIVIDDGSTDTTGNIIDRYAATDSRIVTVHQKNAGLVAVREHGIKLANGKYAAFVDGDDALEPDMYERLMMNLLNYDADISHCGVAFCWPDGKVDQHYGTGKLIVQNNFEGQKDLLEGKQVEPGLWNKLYKTEILKNSCLDTSVLNNEDLLRNFIVFQRAKKSVFEDFCGYRYRQRPGSMSKDQSKIITISNHIFRARQLIVEHSTNDIYPYAMQTWMSCVVNFLKQVSGSKDSELKKYGNQCRQFLKMHHSDFKYLSKKQRALANMYLYLPSLGNLVYGIYQKRR